MEENACLVILCMAFSNVLQTWGMWKSVLAYGFTSVLYIKKYDQDLQGSHSFLFELFLHSTYGWFYLYTQSPWSVILGEVFQNCIVLSAHTWYINRKIEAMQFDAPPDQEEPTDDILREMIQHIR